MKHAAPSVRRKILARVGVAALGMIAALAGAQTAFPSKPIKLILPTAPGSNADVLTRKVTPKWSEYLGQPIVIENKTGASGTIAAAFVAKAEPDGYTILLGTSPTHGSGPAWLKNVPYDPVADFTPIGLFCTSGYVLAVSTALPVTSVAELVAYARARPGQLSYATLGEGTGTHLAALGFEQRIGVDLLHVPYNAQQAITDVATNRVTMIFYPYPGLGPLVDAGKLRALATTSQKRSKSLPNLPTMIESGLDYSETAWHGFYAPANTPKAIIDTLYAGLARALNDPGVIAGLTELTVDVAPMSPAEFGEFTKSQVAFHKQFAEKARRAK